MSEIEPGETKLRWFRRGTVLAGKLLPAWLRRLLRNQLFGVTPSVPFTLLDLASDAPPVRALIAGTILGLAFCFGGTVIVTLLSGTLVGNAPGYLYFLHDRTNIVNYAVVCPLYLGTASAFIVAVMQAWNRVRRSPVVRGENARVPRLPLGIVVFLVFGASAGLTTRYIMECLNPAIYARAAWYVSVGPHNERYLNSAGIYYALLNFTLLFISLLAFMHLGLFGCVAAEIGRALRSRAPSNSLKFERLLSLLREFTCAYILAKLLAAIYIANAFTWKWEKPQGSFNLRAMVWFLAVFGVLVVSFPRYYLEIEWFYFKVRQAEANGQPPPRDADDIRDKWIRDVATVLDIAFGITTVVSLL